MPSSTRTSCVVLSAGCAVLLLLQHQLLAKSPAAGTLEGARPASSRAAPAPTAGASDDSRLLRTEEGAGARAERAAGLPATPDEPAAARGHAEPEDAAAAALAARARAAAAAAARAADEEVSAEPHPDAALGGDMFDEPVLLREAAAVALRRADGRRELILIPTSFSYGHYTLNLLLNIKRLGYAHALLLGAGREECEAATALSPVPSRCVWDGRWQRDAKFRQLARPWASFCPRGPLQCDSKQEPQVGAPCPSQLQPQPVPLPRLRLRAAPALWGRVVRLTHSPPIRPPALPLTWPG